MSWVGLYGVIGLEEWPTVDERIIDRHGVTWDDGEAVPLLAKLDGRIHRVGTVRPWRPIAPTVRWLADAYGCPREATLIFGDAMVSTDTAVGQWVATRSKAGPLPCGMSLVNMTVDIPDDPDEAMGMLFGGMLPVGGGRLADVVLYDNERAAFPAARLWRTR